jgi:hypothetical protein
MNKTNTQFTVSTLLGVFLLWCSVANMGIKNHQGETVFVENQSVSLSI